MIITLIEGFNNPGTWVILESHIETGKIKSSEELATYLSACLELGLTVTPRSDGHGRTNYVIREDMIM